MKLSDKIIIPPQVMTRYVEEELVILDLEGGVYYGLDPVGARIWQLMTEGKKLVEICDTMEGEYEVSREILEGDVIHLVQNLIDNRLITTAPADLK